MAGGRGRRGGRSAGVVEMSVIGDEKGCRDGPESRINESDVGQKGSWVSKRCFKNPC